MKILIIPKALKCTHSNWVFRAATNPKIQVRRVYQLIGLFSFLWLTISSASAQQEGLNLDKVLQSVNTYYPKIKIARFEISKAQGALIKSKGKFDPYWEASIQSQPAGGYINNYGDIQLTIPTLYNGIKLFAGYRNGRGDWPIYYQDYLTNSVGEYRAGLSLPLLRDRAIDKQRAQLLSSAQSVLMKKNEAEVIKIKIYQEAIEAYWQWMEAGFQLKIFKQLLKLAKVRQHAVEQQAQEGDLPKLAISENLQQIIQREQLLNQAKMIFEQAGINLSLYYRDTQGKPKVPLENSLPYAMPSRLTSLSQSATRLTEHPALKKLENYSKIILFKRNLAQNEFLPQLDASVYTFKQNGSGGYPELIPQAVMVGLSFKFPLFRREAKGNLIQSQILLNQVTVEKKFLYEQFKNELFKMLIGIRRKSQQVAILKKELNLAYIVEIGETKKFSEGDSTLFLVNQREQLTTQIQLNYLHTQAELEELKDKVCFFSGD